MIEKNTFQTYDKINELTHLINLDNKKLPEMSKVFFDSEKRPVIYKEKSEEEKQLITNIRKEDIIKLSKEIDKELAEIDKNPQNNNILKKLKNIVVNSYIF